MVWYEKFVTYNPLIKFEFLDAIFNFYMSMVKLVEYECKIDFCSVECILSKGLCFIILCDAM